MLILIFKVEVDAQVVDGVLQADVLSVFMMFILNDQ
jgi:hypothetical protein